MKNWMKIFVISALGGFISLGTYKVFFEKENTTTYIETERPVQRKASYTTPESLTFTYAAEKTVHSVVHVKVATKAQSRGPSSPFEFFFGVPQRSPNRERLRMGSGSGVILSADGYIVTNNHVIEDAENIRVTLNNEKEYEAELVGTDPTTDIALLKIEAENSLEAIKYSNSDEVKLGEWVLAVGNPFNLTSTVTAGIVSAKGRNIGIIDEKFAIESFIQTDAAVNPGNSGGALVNTDGELVGINSAISASGSGTFMGYSFAVPSNIVKKVVEDLKKYGTVQRAFIGVNISDVNAKIADELKLDRNSGVYVAGTTPNGAAQEAGIKARDVIIAVNGEATPKSSVLQELIGRKRPGDKVTVTVLRGNNKEDFTLTLRNANGTTKMVKKEDLSYVNQLGGSLRPLNGNEREKYGLNYGLVVDEVNGGIMAEQNIPEGYIVARINGQPVSSIDDLNEAADEIDPGEAVVLQGLLPDGRVKYYAFAR